MPYRQFKVARKQATPAIHRRQLISVEIESHANHEEGEAEAQLQLTNRSGLEPEDMTGELENPQPKSAPARKATEERSRIQTRQMTRSKGKAKAQDAPEPHNTSQQKRKRDQDIFDVFITSEDEADAQGNGQLKSPRRASKRQNTNGTSEHKSKIIPAKRPRGRPRKKVIEEEPIFENEPEERADDSDADLVDPADIGKAVPTNAQQMREVDEEDDEGNEDNVEGEVEHGDDDNDGPEDQNEGDDVTGYQMSPVKPNRRVSRGQHLKSAKNSRTISSNHANGIHNNGSNQSSSRSGRREEAARKAGERSGEAADVGEEPEEEVDDSTDYEEEEDEQELSRKLALWSGIIDVHFFLSVKRISKRLGCQKNVAGNTWDTVTPVARGVKTNSGKILKKALKNLRAHYQDLDHAMDEGDETSQIKANSDINQTTDYLNRMVDNMLQPLAADISDHYQNRRRKFLTDVYIVLVRKFLTVLKIAVLTYGKYHRLSDEGLLVVIKITKVILRLFENLDKQKKELQPKDCGQTKQPINALRPFLRDTFLKNCQGELGERKRIEERAEERARTQQSQSHRQEEDARREAEEREEARRIREYNQGLLAGVLNDPERGRQIKLHVKQIENSRRSQSEKVQLELDAIRAKKSAPRRQITREEAAAMARRNQRNVNWDDPLSEDDEPGRNAKSSGIFSQFQRKNNTAPVPPSAPSPSPSPSPESEPEPPAPIGFKDIPDSEKQNFYDHFKEKYRLELETGLEDEEFWDRLQRNLCGGSYTLDEIFGFAKELQVTLDDAHENGKFLGDEHLWTLHVWEWV
ncbi:hypothetical protein SBOR_4535 [Sclerotinia borealis F-4128]|uniref:Uncharacterized protein n=1 Tax=Sclerotinia borealis (strain F-4128) TaxID=1432307 RepID=W9CKL9_SCLBF|nr:hypothetical protein SBOR_4535 [Sclerotinia borealis F-4128]